MHEALKRRLGRAAAAAALIFGTAATWFVLDRTEHRPGWLVVEAPAVAGVGQPLEIHVTLGRSVEATEIDCTLHHANADRKGWGYLASSGPARPAAGGGTYSFVFVVPEHADTAFVFAIVYLRPTGKWEDGTRAVTTKYIPVEKNGATAPGLAVRRTPVYRYPTAAEAARTRPRGVPQRSGPSVWVHPVLSVLLLAAAGLCLAKGGRRRPEAGVPAAAERTVWILFGFVFIICAAIELSGIAGHLAAWARRLAEEEHLYEGRKTFQKTIMAAAAAASLGLFFLFIRAARRPGSHRFLWWTGIGLADYLAVSFVSVLSFHAVDVAGNMTWHGISPVDGLRGAGAIVALIAAGLAVRQMRRKPPV